MIDRILLFGDSSGLPMLLRALPRETVCGVAGAAIRPQYHAELRRLAEETGVPFAIQPLPDSSDYGSFVRWIRDLSPQLIWINSYSMRLHADVVSIPHAGALNIHGALLPFYRGCNPAQWAILRGEHKTGVTLHVVTAGIDEGPIIARKEVPLLFEDTWKDVRDRIAEATERLLQECVPGILSGAWRAEPQDEGAAWYGRRRKPEDGYFSWDDSVLDIYNLIRALVAPHPGAFFEDPEAGKTVIDRFIPLNQVIGMKIRHRGKSGFLCSDRLCLRLLENEESVDIWHGNESREFPSDEGPVVDGVESVPPDRSDALSFIIEKADTKKAIGSCQLLNINWIHRNAELQIRIGEGGFQGKGYGSEAVRLLVDFGFKDLHLHRIYLHVFSSNARAIKAYEKCGFEREGVLREAAYIDGGFVDVVAMAILRGQNG